MTQNDSGQGSMNFTHSPSPSPSMLSTSSNSSRLSQDEIEQILTSPFDTGYTYSQSAAYRKEGPTEFRHPQLCRRFKQQMSDPNYNSFSQPSDDIVWNELIGSKRKNIFIRAIIFSITALVYSLTKGTTIIGRSIKWLFVYLIFLPMLSACYVLLYTGQLIRNALFVTTSYALATVGAFFSLFKSFRPIEGVAQTFNWLCFSSSVIGGSLYSYTVNTLKAVGIWSLWLLSLGFVDVGSKRQVTDDESVGGVRTRAQLNKLSQKVKLRYFEEGVNESRLTKFGSIWGTLFWPFAKVWSLCNSVVIAPLTTLENSFTTPKFTSTPTIAARITGIGKRFSERRIAPSFWENLGSVCCILMFLVIRLSLFLALAYFIYSTIGQAKLQLYFGDSSAELLALKTEIEQLKNELHHTIYESEKYRLNQAIENVEIKTEIISDAELDAKIKAIIERLKNSENEERVVELREFERRVLDNARSEVSATVANFQITLQDSAAEAAANIARTEDSKVVRNVLSSANSSMENLKLEIDKKIAGFMDSINSRENEKTKKLMAELDQLRNKFVEEKKQNEKTVGKENDLLAVAPFNDSIYLSKVQELIKAYINRYDADKTGLPDYALESSGGSIASIRCTVPFNERSRTHMIFGIPLWFSSYSPRSVIQRKGHGATAGECWAFVGSHGYLTIKLSNRINVTAISYEHLPVQLSPEGHIQTAPKNFLVYSYQEVDDLDSRYLLGNFTYDDKGDPLQTFQMQHYNPLSTPFIEFEVVSNYGAMVTCLYRFRVHGNLTKSIDGTGNNNGGNNP